MMTNPTVVVTLIKENLDDQNVEVPHCAETKSCSLSPDAPPPLKVAIHSSRSLDNYQQLNVVRT
jgi:hypothetical protein